MIIHLTKKISGIWNDQKAKIQKVFVAFLFLSAFFLRIHYIDALDLWGDEAFTVITASKNWGRILQIFEGDVHPPLHTIILKLWALVFGNTEIAVRMLSVVFGMGTLVVVYQLSKKIFNNARYSLMTLALAAVNPLLIYYSQEARSYSMLIFFSTSAIFFAFYSNSRFKNILLLFNLLAGMYTHYIFFFIVGSIYAIKTLQIIKPIGTLKTTHYLKKLLRPDYITFTLILVMMCLPLIKIFLYQIATYNGGGFWSPNPIMDIKQYLPNFFTGHTLTISPERFPTALRNLIPLLGLTLTVRGIYYEFKTKKYSPILSLFLLTTLVSIFIATYVIPLFYIRYLTFATPAILLLAVYGATSSIKGRKKNMGSLAYYSLLAATLILLFSNIFPGLPDTKPHTREVLRYIEQNKKPSQIIIHPPTYNFLTFKYYAPNKSFMYDSPSMSKMDLYFRGLAPVDPQDFFKGDLTTYRYLWVVPPYRVAKNFKISEEFKKFLTDQNFNKQENRSFPGGLELELWKLRSEN